MNRHSDAPSSPASKNTETRELFVTGDYHSIPIFEMRPLLGGVGVWLRAVVSHKVLRKKVKPDHAVELRRLKKAKHVPKRMQKHLAELAKKLESLEFESNYHSTVAAIGPWSAVTLAMSQPDGEIHFFATRATTKIGRQVHDEDHFEYRTWLNDGTLVETVSTDRLHRPRGGVDRGMIDSSDPAVVLRKHRERIRMKQVEPVPPPELFERMESENCQSVDDLLRRGVVRRATAAEVTRIRAAMSR